MNAETLDPSVAFTYLVRKVVYNNKDWADLYQNLWKVWRGWGMVGKLVTKAGKMVLERGMVYKAILRLMLLYGSKSWVVTGGMLKLQEIFHHQV